MTSKSLPTATGGLDSMSFDGVFREVHSRDAHDKLIQVQARLQEDDFVGARAIVQSAIDSSTDDHDVRNLRLIASEITRYQNQAISPDCPKAKQVSFADVGERNVEKLYEKFSDLVQSIFHIRLESKGGATRQLLVGRRILSHQYRSGKIRELHCSLITPSMLLGAYEDHRVGENGVTVYFRPLTNEEKRSVIDDILESGLTSAEVVFPYPVLVSPDRHELSCPPDGWEIDEPLAEQLGEGEVLIREYAQEFLRGLGNPNLRLYDSACSTGQFLATMKQAVPGAYVIGQDLSSYMVGYAKKRLDESYVGNAIEPKIAESSVDVGFVRFVNSEVVKTAEALSLLLPTGRCVKPGGYLIVLGHTPVLVSAAEFRLLPEWSLIQSIGGGKEWEGIFQFYILQKRNLDRTDVSKL